MLEKSNFQTYGIERHPFTYKKTNEKNNVWEDGIEQVRGFKVDMVNSWIKHEETTLKIFKDLVKKSEEKVADHIKTKNSRYSR